MAEDVKTNIIPPPVDERPMTKEEQTPLEERGIYGKDGKLTHAGMQAVVAGGGSVLHQGSIIWRVQDLPKPEDLAAGDPNKLLAAESDLKVKMAELQARLDAIEATKAHPVALVGDDLPPGVRVGTHGEPGHGDTAGLGAEERIEAARKQLLESSTPDTKGKGK